MLTDHLAKVIRQEELFEYTLYLRQTAQDLIARRLELVQQHQAILRKREALLNQQTSFLQSLTEARTKRR